ncbi:aquaporin [Rhizobium sp. NRK18]|uniref:aquaporin n=1 Tax=Rhizobium sp. NRK18 TaxID=2964667 RepID=UPI0021C35B6E|nr:MIP/aquaporin family protein [Rhizobium sp. NRK18]MCQ2003976.1 aquaporin family protein [Rhizobium sp. NRK18]
MTSSRKLVAELLGTALLLATVVGSGIMAERLSGGNVAIALLCNTIPTGAILFVLITVFGPVSGANFNPAVTMVFHLRREVSLEMAFGYVVMQVTGAIIGVWAAHLMFDLDLLQYSDKVRSGPGQWFAEGVATFGLVTVILGALNARPQAVAACVGLYITAAYWFTASTSFANPAVTIARTLSRTFAGIRPLDAPAFVAAEFASALLAFLFCRWFLVRSKPAG